MKLRRPARIPPGVLVWGIPAAVVLIISTILTLRQLERRSDDVPRFSGSAEVLRMQSLLRSPRLPGRLGVVIVRDDAAASYFGSSRMLDSAVQAWREALALAGADVRVLRSSQLAGASRARVLVIPASPCLSVGTREAIEAAGARGQGLIVTGLAGVHDAGCRPLGYGLIVGLTGAARADTLRSRSNVYVGIPTGSPLAADIPPGARLELRPAAQVALRRVARDGFYAGYDLAPAPIENEPLLDVALTRATYRGARVVYWGFDLHDAVSHAWNADLLALLARNSVAWAGRMPLASIEPWPKGKVMAAVLAQDVEEQFSNVRFARDSLAAIGIPGTFYLLSDAAKRNKRLSRELLRAGEVGSHSENHRLLGGTPPDAQRTRLVGSQRDLTDILGEPVSGLRPPQEQFDLATMEAWIAAGGSYLLGANDGRCVAPELLRVGGDTLVLLPRTGVDDYALLGPGARSGDLLDDRLMAEYRRVRAHGGLHVLSYHSQLLSAREHVPTLARFARTLAADTAVWVATAGDVASWWRSRAMLESSATIQGSARIDVTVQNHGAKPLWGAVVRVDLPAPRSATQSTAPLLASEPGVLRVVVPYIAPRSRQLIPVFLGAER